VIDDGADHDLVRSGEGETALTRRNTQPSINYLEGKAAFDRRRETSIDSGGFNQNVQRIEGCGDGK
jgi:hypothetical protein